jgi:two-component system nitrogen regulation response regulator NtrX
VVPIEVPSLRERKEDIPVLVDNFLDEFARLNGTPKKRISPEALELLSLYHWPGNVRELKNLIGRLAILVDKEMIEPADLPRPYNPAEGNEKQAGEDKLFSMIKLEEAVDKFEIEFLKRKYRFFEEDIAKTAENVGVKQNYIKKKLQL